MAIVTVTDEMGRWVKFRDIGDKIDGVVVEYSPHSGATDYNGNPVGYLSIERDDGSLHRVELSLTDLKSKVARALPSPGRWMSIAYREDKPSKRGKPIKIFEVQYDDETGDGTPPAQATAAHGDQLDGGDLPF